MSESSAAFRDRRRRYLRNLQRAYCLGRGLPSMAPLFGVGSALASQHGFLPNALFWPAMVLVPGGVVLGTLAMQLLPGPLAAVHGLRCALARRRSQSVTAPDGQCEAVALGAGQGSGGELASVVTPKCSAL